MFFVLTVLTILASSFYLSVFEWTLHRNVMHRPFLRITYAFKAHALVHHRIFQADNTYLLQNEPDKRTITMAWWNGLVLIVLTTSPAIVISWIFGAWWVTTGVILASILYYSTYEYLHWCMHFPKQRFVEKFSFFIWLNGHHLLHHHRTNTNLNVVFPFADLIFGTLITRAKLNFVQAKGQSIPDVQPIK